MFYFTQSHCSYHNQRKHSEDAIATNPTKPTQSLKHKVSGDAVAGNATPAPKRSRLTGPTAVKGVADALSAIAYSLTDSSGTHPSNSPQCRTLAIKKVAADESLSMDERVKAMHLFRKEIATADTYLAIDEQSLRVAYIKDELADL